MRRRREPIYDSDAVLMAATDRELRALGEALRRERDQRDPVAWMNQRLGAVAYSKQQEIASSVRDHRHLVGADSIG